VLHVRVDGPFRDHQLHADLAVGHALRDQGGDLGLAPGEHPSRGPAAGRCRRGQFVGVRRGEQHDVVERMPRAPVVQRGVPLRAHRVGGRLSRPLVALFHARLVAEPGARPVPERISRAQQPARPLEPPRLGRQPAKHLQRVRAADLVTELVLGAQRIANCRRALVVPAGYLEQRETGHQVQVTLDPPLGGVLAEPVQAARAPLDGQFHLTAKLVQMAHMRGQGDQPDVVVELFKASSRLGASG
jgi:hypothetical protein